MRPFAVIGGYPPETLQYFRLEGLVPPPKEPRDPRRRRWRLLR